MPSRSRPGRCRWRNAWQNGVLPSRRDIRDLRTPTLLEVDPMAPWESPMGGPPVTWHATSSATPALPPIRRTSNAWVIGVSVPAGNRVRLPDTCIRSNPVPHRDDDTFVAHHHGSEPFRNRLHLTSPDLGGCRRDSYSAAVTHATSAAAGRPRRREYASTTMGLQDGGGASGPPPRGRSSRPPDESPVATRAVVKAHRSPGRIGPEGRPDRGRIKVRAAGAGDPRSTA
jgi:hypothetical protein